MNIPPNVLRRVLPACSVALLSACHCFHKPPAPGACAYSGVQMLDVEDNFAPPGLPRVQSPQLVFYMDTTASPEQGFDADSRTGNHEFGVSFRLDRRRLCSVRVEVRGRIARERDGGLWGGYHNDWIAIGRAPFDSTSPVFHRGAVWPTSSTPQTLSIELPVGAVQRYIDSADDPMIDLYIHDDTNVDFIRVTHTYN